MNDQIHITLKRELFHPLSHIFQVRERRCNNVYDALNSLLASL